MSELDQVQHEFWHISFVWGREENAGEPEVEPTCVFCGEEFVNKKRKQTKEQPLGRGEAKRDMVKKHQEKKPWQGQH